MSTPETIVNYQWPDDPQRYRVKVSDFTATAETEQITLPGTCESQSYIVTSRIHYRQSGANCIYWPRTIQSSILGIITGETRDECINGLWRFQIASRYADGSLRYWYSVGSGCQCQYQRTSGQILSVNLSSSSTGCAPNACKFIVKDSQGAIVFSDQREGGCPTWSIEGDCPPDTLKCGDCCLDCGDYLGSVRSLTNQVKQLQSQPLDINR